MSDSAAAGDAIYRIVRLLQHKDVPELEAIERRLATEGPAPVAWTIPGDDTADANGFIPARISKDGEFTKPLYGREAI